MSPDVNPVLALDTHGQTTGLALFRNGETLVVTASLGRDLDAGLASFVADSLHSWGVNFKDIKGFVVVVGPGGFNGLRIGLAYIRGLALALGVPVYGVSSLEAKIGDGPIPLWDRLPARRRDPDKSWWVQRFDSDTPHKIEELDFDAIQSQIDPTFDPKSEPDTREEGAHFAARAIAWWQAGREMRKGAEAAFVRSALR